MRVDTRPNMHVAALKGVQVFGGRTIHAVAEDGRRTIAYCGRHVHVAKTTKRVSCPGCVRELEKLGYAS